MNSSEPVPTSSQLPLSPGREVVRAPTENGTFTSSPDVYQARQLATSNSQRLENATTLIAERPLGEFRVWARGACLAQAQLWMLRTLGSVPRLPEGLFYVTGHQPTLNHPGVWMKNVAVSHLARCAGTTGINLIVDNDVAGPPAIRVPGGTRATPRFDLIAYDDPCPAQPWEERQLQNDELFESFPERVSAALAPWNLESDLSQSWSAALETRSRTRSTASLLTACRVAEERSWDVTNLELPVSEMCQTEPFLAFAQHVIQHHERFFSLYNSSVHWYRKQYRVRNHRHPVPDLEQLEDQFELPFWYWEPGETERHRVFVCRRPEGLVLFASRRSIAVVPESGCDVSTLQSLQGQGRFRTRALTTTLFARLCLADLFIHGIGGARYDEITDRLIQEFFELTPPSFLTLTATVRLPLNPHPVDFRNLSALQQRLRKLPFEGPSHLESAEILALRQQQAQLIEAAQRQREARETRAVRRALRPVNRRRHLELRQTQELLGGFASREIEQTREQIEELERQEQANQILNSREFPVCLFSRTTLEPVVNRLRSAVCTGRSTPEMKGSTLSLAEGIDKIERPSEVRPDLL